MKDLPALLEQAQMDVHDAINNESSNPQTELLHCLHNLSAATTDIRGMPLTEATVTAALLGSLARVLAYESGRLYALGCRADAERVDGLTRPGAKLNDGTVIASCVYCDDDGRDEYLIMRLMSEPPFYEVAIWDFLDGQQKRTPIWGRRRNINEATELYAQMGGDI